MTNGCQKSSTIETEVVIVGGGLVGMAMALSLAQENISSLLIEAQDTSNLTTESHFDDRTLVINPASLKFWQALKLWSLIEPHSTVINQVHVSNQGHFGMVNFDKNELKVPQLGHVVAAKTLAFVLDQQVRSSALITYSQPAELKCFDQHDEHIECEMMQAGKSIQVLAKLMVAADGVQSDIRKQLGLTTAVKSYQRTAIVANLTTSSNHANKAYERLTQEGPMALLPFNNRYGLVWSMNNEQAKSLLTADDSSFKAQAQQAFGYRAGSFMEIGRRSSYPLYQIKVPKQHADRVVLMGNAAHAVSPVSAQGLNLAVRGIKRLVSILSQNKKQSIDLGLHEVLAQYQKASQDDQQRTLDYTDDLMTWFQIDEPFINAMRSLGLVAINASLSLKKSLYETAGGLKS